MLAGQKAASVLPSDTGRSLPANRRLRRRVEFEHAFRSGRLVNAWFAVYARKNEYTFSRIGIAASKKVMPNAVSRNLSKRLIRETFRLEFPVGAAMDVVVYPKRRISQKNLAESRNALRQLLAAAQ